MPASSSIASSMTGASRSRVSVGKSSSVAASSRHSVYAENQLSPSETGDRNHEYHRGGEEEDYSDIASSVSSNPTIWDNNIPRKMMDMQWNFSANPLRVADCSGKHWKRLTATYRSMIPQPGGGVLLLKQKYPHISDDELLHQVACSGVAKIKPERKLPPLPEKREVDTPMMRERLKKAMVPPVPKPPKLVLVPDKPIKEQLEAYHLDDDASSLFSQSTAWQPAGSVATKARSSVSTTIQSNKPRREKAPSQVASAAGQSKASRGEGSKAAASSVGAASRTSSRVTQLKAEIEKERQARMETEEKLSEVAESLTRVEALLGDRK